MNKKPPLVFFAIAILFFISLSVPNSPFKLAVWIIYYLSIPVFLYLFWKKKL